MMMQLVLLWVQTCNVKQFHLLKPEAPFVGTGVEYIAARDSGSTIVAKADGVVSYVDAQ